MATKLLIGLSDECNDALRHACGKERPLGPYVEGLLAETIEVRTAAKELRIKLPERLTDGRGKYTRNKKRKSGRKVGYH